MTSRHGGADRVSAKSRASRELRAVGEVLAAARKEKGIKQQDVAAVLGLPASYLSKVEAGDRRLDVVEFIRLARAAGLAPEDLILRVETAIAAEPGNRGPASADSK